MLVYDFLLATLFLMVGRSQVDSLHQLSINVVCVLLMIADFKKTFEVGV